MGAGASSFPGDGRQYFCHQCARQVIVASDAESIVCPYCEGSFLEETMDHAVVPFRNSSDDAGGGTRGEGQLTAQQSMRLANAAAILRILELQLREELEQLQSSQREEETKDDDNNVLTKCMAASLRNKYITVEDIEDQPLCPICCEDYTPGEMVKMLPCKHVFHGECVMPWLDAKKACPICRVELEDKVPSLEQLRDLPPAELERHFEEQGVTKPQGDNVDSEALAKALHEFYLKDRHVNERIQAEREQMRQSMMASRERITGGGPLGRENRTTASFAHHITAFLSRQPHFLRTENSVREGNAASEYGNAPSTADESQMRIVRRPLMITDPSQPMESQSMGPSIGFISHSIRGSENSSPTFSSHPSGSNPNPNPFATMRTGGVGGVGGVPVNRTFILRSNGPGGSASAVPVIMTTNTPERNLTPTSDSQGQDEDALGYDMPDEINVVD